MNRIYTPKEMTDQTNYTLIISNVNKTFTVKNLTMNGTNYVSETKVDTSSWPKIFKLIVKNNDNTVKKIEHAKLIQQVSYAWDHNKWYLSFAPVSQQEVNNHELKAQLEYLAMMADIDLEN